MTNKKAELPVTKAARLSFKTRSFPYLPLDRFGFISIYKKVYGYKAVNVKPEDMYGLLPGDGQDHGSKRFADLVEYEVRQEPLAPMSDKGAHSHKRSMTSLNSEVILDLLGYNEKD